MLPSIHNQRPADETAEYRIPAIPVEHAKTPTGGLLEKVPTFAMGERTVRRNSVVKGTLLVAERGCRRFEPCLDCERTARIQIRVKRHNCRYTTIIGICINRRILDGRIEVAHDGSADLMTGSGEMKTVSRRAEGSQIDGGVNGWTCLVQA